VISPGRSAHLALASHHRRRLPSLLLVALSLTAAVTTGACRVDKNAFDDRIFHCDTTAPDPLCGTDVNGDNMTCFAARQIGGVDFCTPFCGDKPMSLPGGAECVQGGAALKGCAPSADSLETPACGRPDLGCLRTNVLADEGVCLTMNPCSKNTDCLDPVRSTCGATFLHELYTQAPDLTSDHLYCLQEGCLDGHSLCSAGEICLPTKIPAAAHPPDICVPKCDSRGRCPPNHFCLSTVSGPANPPVCIPGLLGFVCQNDIDCLLGKCTSDGDAKPLKLCTATCDRDQDCTKFDSVQGRFVCSNDHRCITPDAYTGTLCRTTADCGIRDPDTICAKPPGDPTLPSTCLRPCDVTNPAAPCAARGGIGHTCLPFVDAADATKTDLVCYPGNFGYPCFDTSQCAVPELSCAAANLTDPAGPKPGFCSILCTKDADCQNNRWTGGEGYCGAPALPVCIPFTEDGAECQDAKECRSNKCGAPAQSMPGAPAKVCGGTP
jgi:hypothetical protein